MVCAGTGVAPFRGFVQERAAQIAAGRKLAPALLVVGCRAPAVDELYRDQFDLWEAMKAVKIVRTYSQHTEASAGLKYAQEALVAHGKEVLELWDNGARVYVCGSRDLEVGVKQAIHQLAEDRAKSEGRDFSEERYEKWFESMRNVRFATDVFT